jgi:signal transduction histidine kinase
VSGPGEHPAAGGLPDPSDLTGRELDEAVGAVGHDLRAPLTSVLGYAQLMGADDSLSEVQHGYVDVIERNGRRLLRLIDELLLSVQLSAGELGITRRDVDLAEVSRACCDELGPTARAAGVSLTVTAPEPVLVSGDPDLLAQVITSLLDGAIRRTPRGGAVTVRVGLRDDVRAGARAAAPQEVSVEVSDTGAGLEPAELGRLTEGLYRARGAGGSGIRGIALGLPVVQAAVDALGGTMDFDRVHGAGTRVRVTLPAGRPTGSPTSGSGEAGSTPR